MANSWNRIFHVWDFDIILFLNAFWISVVRVFTLNTHTHTKYNGPGEEWESEKKKNWAIWYLGYHIKIALHNKSMNALTTYTTQKKFEGLSFQKLVSFEFFSRFFFFCENACVYVLFAVTVTFHFVGIYIYAVTLCFFPAIFSCVLLAFVFFRLVHHSICVVVVVVYVGCELRVQSVSILYDILLLCSSSFASWGFIFIIVIFFSFSSRLIKHIFGSLESLTCFSSTIYWYG